MGPTLQDCSQFSCHALHAFFNRRSFAPPWAEVVGSVPDDRGLCQQVAAGFYDPGHGDRKLGARLFSELPRLPVSYIPAQPSTTATAHNGTFRKTGHLEEMTVWAHGMRTWAEKAEDDSRAVQALAQELETRQACGSQEVSDVRQWAESEAKLWAKRDAKTAFLMQWAKRLDTWALDAEVRLSRAEGGCSSPPPASPAERSGVDPRPRGPFVSLPAVLHTPTTAPQTDHIPGGHMPAASPRPSIRGDSLGDGDVQSRGCFSFLRPSPFLSSKNSSLASPPAGREHRVGGGDAHETPCTPSRLFGARRAESWGESHAGSRSFAVSKGGLEESSCVPPTPPIKEEEGHRWLVEAKRELWETKAQLGEALAGWRAAEEELEAATGEAGNLRRRLCEAERVLSEVQAEAGSLKGALATAQVESEEGRRGRGRLEEEAAGERERSRGLDEMLSRALDAVKERDAELARLWDEVMRGEQAGYARGREEAAREVAGLRAVNRIISHGPSPPSPPPLERLHPTPGARTSLEGEKGRVQSREGAAEEAPRSRGAARGGLFAGDNEGMSSNGGRKAATARGTGVQEVVGRRKQGGQASTGASRGEDAAGKWQF